MGGERCGHFLGETTGVWDFYRGKGWKSVEERGIRHDDRLARLAPSMTFQGLVKAHRQFDWKRWLSTILEERRRKFLRLPAQKHSNESTTPSVPPLLSPVPTQTMLGLEGSILTQPMAKEF